MTALKTKFYTFHQNDSYGVYHSNESATYYVIIEAISAADANERAEGVGVYFKGCAKGIDCPCCGDRWWPWWGTSGTDQPEIHGELAHKYDFDQDTFVAAGEVVCYIYLMNGATRIYVK